MFEKIKPGSKSKILIDQDNLASRILHIQNTGTDYPETPTPYKKPIFRSNNPIPEGLQLPDPPLINTNEKEEIIVK